MESRLCCQLGRNSVRDSTSYPVIPAIVTRDSAGFASVGQGAAVSRDKVTRKYLANRYADTLYTILAYGYPNGTGAMT
jgi:hypothetical protein